MVQQFINAYLGAFIRQLGFYIQSVRLRLKPGKAVCHYRRQLNAIVSQSFWLKRSGQITNWKLPTVDLLTRMPIYLISVKRF